MASWTDIDTNRLLPGEPWTSGKALALEENIRALAEQSSGAPRIADNVVSGEASGGGNLIFSGLQEYSGFLAWGGYDESGGADNMVVAYALNGGALSSNTTIINQAGSFVFFLDFTTGAWQAISTGSNLDINTGTIAGIDETVTDLRFSSTSSDLVIMATPQGGLSA